ncbi:MAG: DUF2807 domain-containing protein [Chlorobi bacterium]|nr:DUF2807 domain-containing protein [Chlorobiota bacterium]
MKTKLKIMMQTMAFLFALLAVIPTQAQMATQERQVEPFSSIRQTTFADVYISYGEKSSVTVKADSDIINRIITRVENGVLTITSKGNFRNVHVLDVYVTMPRLDKLMNTGSGDIVCKGPLKGKDVEISVSGSGDLRADMDAVNLEMKISGSGDVNLSGVRGIFQLTITGSGDVNAADLQLDTCAVYISGSGDVKLKGKAANLITKIVGSGDLNAYGLTAVNVNAKSNGSGDIVVSVVERVEALLNGSGDLVYYGSPAYVNVVSNGSGDVYRK